MKLSQELKLIFNDKTIMVYSRGSPDLLPKPGKPMPIHNQPNSIIAICFDLLPVTSAIKKLYTPKEREVGRGAKKVKKFNIRIEEQEETRDNFETFH